MVRRSRGFRSRTRRKLSKSPRERGVTRPSKVIQNFDEGSRAIIDLDSSIQKGRPNSRYQGATGTVVEHRGRAYVLEIRDGGKTKRIISRPEHLRVV